MPTTNDPYSRPINATRPEHVLVGEHYGERSKHSQRTAVAGNDGGRAAAPYRGEPVVPDEFKPTKVSKRKGTPSDPVSLPLLTHNQPLVTDSQDPTSPSPDTSSPSDDDTPDMPEPVITEEDLFG